MFYTIIVHCKMVLIDFMEKYGISISEMARITLLHRHTVRNGLNNGFTKAQRDFIRKRLHMHYGQSVIDLGDLDI